VVGQELSAERFNNGLCGQIHSKDERKKEERKASAYTHRFSFQVH
jgi:hypothetical protein